MANDNSQRSATMVWTVAVAMGWFFCVLASYYIIRPLREALGSSLPQGEVERLFGWVFMVMVLANPVYSYVVAHVPRGRLVPIVYRVFEACLLAFWLVRLQISGPAPTWLAKVFFIWVSVFNLFAVSIFWSFMADIFTREQAHRWFGRVAAAGTLGAICGSYLAQILAVRVSEAVLFWFPLVLLEMALLFVGQLDRLGKRLQAEQSVDPGKGGEVAEPVSAVGPSGAPAPQSGTPAIAAVETPVGGTFWDGLWRVVESPYLLAICLITLFSQLSGTTAYFQMNEVVASSGQDLGQRTAQFGNVNFWTQSLTFVLQTVVAGWVMRSVGVTATLLVVPLVYLATFLYLGYGADLWTLTLAQIAQRGTQLGLMVPAEHALFTVVSREDKYKSKAFIETAIFRGGDFLAGHFYTFVRGQVTSLAGVSYVMVPLVSVWLLIAAWLGHASSQRSEAHDG